MRRVLFLFLLCGLVWMIPGRSIEADDSGQGHHERSGPVRVLWESRYASPASDFAEALSLSPDGARVFITGMSWGDFRTVAYAVDSGEELWTARDGTPANRIYDRAHALTVSPDGTTVFVTGYTGLVLNDWHSPDASTFAYDATTGTKIWESHFDGVAAGRDWLWALDTSPDGATVYAAGVSWGGETERDYVTLAYDSATGDELWVARHDGPGSLADYAYALGVSPDGSTVFVTGGVEPDGAGHDRGSFTTIAYDADTGAQRWRTLYDGPGEGFDAAQALAVDPDGSMVFVTGTSWGVGSDFEAADIATCAYDAATGDEIWVARYNGPGARQDQPAALAVSPDGSKVFVTGHTRESGSLDLYDFATIAYDSATGVEIWNTRYDADNDMPGSLGVSPDGSMVFVTGRSGTSEDDDYVTIAYDAATGDEVWNARYDGPASGQDFSRALGVSPNGWTVVVTGYSPGASEQDHDYATVAYAKVRTVEIGIKPRSVNPGQGGVVPVVIFGSEEFDVSEIDVGSLRFGPNEAPCAHDLTDPFDFNEHLEDVNLDGFMDLVLHFKTQDTGIVCGDTEAMLIGSPLDGMPFEGTDTFETVGCKSHRP